MTAEGFGLFGKVPSKGDFLNDGLPAAFVQPWDDWVKATLRHGAIRMGAQWAACFLSCPVWRFLLAPNVCGPAAWTGIIASSADGVGRPYPLTLAATPPQGSSPIALIAEWAQGYERLTDLALAMMHGAAEQAAARQDLARVSTLLPFPAPRAREPVPPDGAPLPAGGVVRVALGVNAAPRLGGAIARAGRSYTLMWLDGWGLAPFALVGAGLPDPAQTLTNWETAGGQV